MKPFFSIITPNYNCANYIERSYSCLLAQSDIDWEWIIVDDGSSDDSVTIFRRLSITDPRIKIHTFPHNRGRGAARSHAVDNSIGEVAVIWDIDDLYVSTRLSVARKAFEEGVDFFCSYALVVDNSLNLKGARHFTPETNGILPRFVHPTLMVRKDLLQVLKYDEAARAGEDMAVMVGLEQGPYSGKYCEQYLMLYFEDREVNLEKTIIAHKNQYEFAAKYLQESSNFDPALKKWLFRMKIKGWALKCMRVAPTLYLRTVKFRYLENVALKLLNGEHLEIFKKAASLVVK